MEKVNIVEFKNHQESARVSLDGIDAQNILSRQNQIRHICNASLYGV